MKLTKNYFHYSFVERLLNDVLIGSHGFIVGGRSSRRPTIYTVSARCKYYERRRRWRRNADCGSLTEIFHCLTEIFQIEMSHPMIERCWTLSWLYFAVCLLFLLLYKNRWESTDLFNLDCTRIEPPSVRGEIIAFTPISSPSSLPIKQPDNLKAIWPATVHTLRNSIRKKSFTSSSSFQMRDNAQIWRNFQAAKYPTTRKVCRYSHL